MKCLVYCILRDADAPHDGLPAGVDGNTVSLLRDDGLAGVFSVVDDVGNVPELSRAQAYESVIETLHRTCTVLPMQYGCLLPTEAHLKKLLSERRTEFLGSLDQVQGCVEMSLHVTLGAPDGAMPDDESDEGFAQSPGVVHLARLTRRYAQLDTATRTARAVVERCRTAFDGLFVKWKAEYPSLANPLSPGRTLRLFFLVKREDQRAFHGAFRNLVFCTSESGRLTGPWPPHNFVQPEQ